VTILDHIVAKVLEIIPTMALNTYVAFDKIVAVIPVVALLTPSPGCDMKNTFGISAYSKEKTLATSHLS
jgi:hypothetical protein